MIEWVAALGITGEAAAIIVYVILNERRMIRVETIIKAWADGR